MQTRTRQASRATIRQVAARPLVDCAVGVLLLAGAAMVVVPGVLALSAVAGAVALHRLVWRRTI